MERLRRPILAAAALVSLALLPGLARLGTDNSPEVFFVRGSPGVERYQEFRRAFGGASDRAAPDRLVRLAVAGQQLWTDAGLAWLEYLETEAAALDGVASVSGLYQNYRRFAWPPSDPQAFRQGVTESRLDRSLGWVSGDGSMATVLVVLEEWPERRDRELLERLRRLVADPPPGVQGWLVGLPVLNHSLNDASRELERQSLPLLVAFTLALLAFAVRDWKGVAIPLAFVAFCELIVLGPMGYAAVELNMVLAMLPPLLLVIALATSLHVLLRFRDLRFGERHSNAVDATLATYREKGWPVLWTGVSTTIGFASLALSPVGPVRSLGLWTGLGLALMTAAAFVVYPPLVSYGGPGARSKPRHREFEVWAHRLGHRWGRWAHTRRRWVLFAAVLVAAVALAGLPRLAVESNALRYLAADHPVRSGIEKLEAKGIGLANIEVVLSEPGADEGRAPFSRVAALTRLDELTARVEEEPLVFGALSAGSVLRDAARRTPSPMLLSEALHLRTVLARLEREAPEILDALLSADRRSARLTVFVETMGIEELEPFLARLEELARAELPTAEIELTGKYPLLLEAQSYLLSTLMISFAATFIAIAIILRCLLPGFRLTLLALLPNLWPVAGMLGIMGWARIPLDIATVMVASVLLGLAVDDTIHTLGHFRHWAPRYGAREGVVRTVGVTAPAYLLTGVILAAGFSVCALSDFAPLARFGLLAAAGIVLAVLGDLFLLPALLSLTPRKTIARWGSSAKA